MIGADARFHAQVVRRLENGHAGIAQRSDQLQAFAQERPRTQRRKHVTLRAPAILVARGIDERADRHAGADVLPAEQIQQRSAARQHRRCGRHFARALQQDLRRARGQHSRQRPAGDRKRALECAARENHALCVEAADLAVLQIIDTALARDLPHSCVGHVTRAGGGECIGDCRARRVVGSEYLLAARIGAADAAIDLAAHGVLFVDQHRLQPGARRARGRAHAGGTGADHDDVHCFGNKFSGHGHSPKVHLSGPRVAGRARLPASGFACPP